MPPLPVHGAARTDARAGRGWPAFGLYLVALLAVENGKVLVLPTTLAGSWAAVGAGAITAALTLAYARAVRLTWSDLGLAGWRAAAPRSLLAGVSTILALTAGAGLAAHLALILGRSLPVPSPPGDLADLTVGDLVRRLALFLPLDTAIPDEIAFRGAVYGELRRRADSVLLAVLLSSTCFTLAHVALGVTEVPDRAPDQVAMKLAVYLLGGLLFCVPRVVGGHLAGCSVTHWLTDTLLLTLGHPSGAWLRRLVIGF